MIDTHYYLMEGCIGKTISHYGTHEYANRIDSAIVCLVRGYWSLIEAKPVKPHIYLRMIFLKGKAIATRKKEKNFRPRLFFEGISKSNIGPTIYID